MNVFYKRCLTEFWTPMTLIMIYAERAQIPRLCAHMPHIRSMVSTMTGSTVAEHAQVWQTPQKRLWMSKMSGRAAPNMGAAVLRSMLRCQLLPLFLSKSFAAAHPAQLTRLPLLHRQQCPRSWKQNVMSSTTYTNDNNYACAHAWESGPHAHTCQLQPTHDNSTYEKLELL